MTATFVFTDLVDSTATAARLGPEAADELRRTHFKLLRGAVSASGGTEVKNLGDGLMVMYPSPSRAVAGAVGMQQAIEHHNRSAQEALGLRIGVSTGEAVEDDDDYFGDPVVEAARLCAVAKGGQILAADVVRILIGRHATHSFMDSGPMELKGLPEPLPTVEVAWEPETMARFAIPLQDRITVSPAFEFVGRDVEREVLGNALKAAAARDRRVVLLSGEAGLGKTRLATEVARDAFAAGAMVLYGRCDEDVRVPYRPWVEALGHYVAHVSTVELDRLDPRVLGEVAVIVPALRDRLADPAAWGHVSGDGDQYVLFAAITSLLAALAAERPLMIVLDDLHWADRGTLLLLRHVAAQTLATRLLLVGTYRETDIGADDPLTATLAALHRDAGIERLRLEGMSDVEVLSLLEVTAGHEMDADGVELAHALRLETAGNPFFVGEMLRHLAETGEIVQRDDGRWVATVGLGEVGLPESVRAVVGARVHRLGDEALRVLGVAAVVGREFDAILVAAVVDLDEDQVIDILEPAIVAGLVDEVPSDVDRFMFTHALVRRTLYDALPASRRVRWHRRVAEAIETLDDGAQARAGELATHWFAATRPANLDKAIGYAIRAGDQAAAACAPDNAIGWYRQALEAIGGGSDAQRCEVMVKLGDVERQAGDPLYRQRLLDAADLAQRLGDTDLLSKAALANFRGYTLGSVDEERIGALEAAIAAVSDADLPARARLLATLSVELHYDDDRRDAQLARAAIELARRTGDDEVLLDTILRAASALHLPRLFDEWNQLTDEAVHLADGRDDFRRQASLAIRFDALFTLGDMPRLRDCHIARNAIIERLGSRFLRWRTTVEAAVIAATTGDVAEAERLAEEQLVLGSETGQPDTLVFYGTVLLLIRWTRGRAAENIPLLTQVIAENPGLPAYRAVLAVMAGQCGDLDTARAEFEDLAQGDFAFADDVTWLAAHAMSAEAAWMLDDAGAAAILSERLEPYATHIVANGVTCIGAVSHYLGLLAITMGQPAVAERYLTDALDRHRRLHAPFFTARTLLRLADLTRASSPERSSELVDEALELARRHRMDSIRKESLTAR